MLCVFDLEILVMNIWHGLCSKLSHRRSSEYNTVLQIRQRQNALLRLLTKQMQSLFMSCTVESAAPFFLRPSDTYIRHSSCGFLSAFLSFFFFNPLSLRDKERHQYHAIFKSWTLRKRKMAGFPPPPPLFLSSFFFLPLRMRKEVGDSASGRGRRDN